MQKKESGEAFESKCIQRLWCDKYFVLSLGMWCRTRALLHQRALETCLLIYIVAIFSVRLVCVDVSAMLKTRLYGRHCRSVGQSTTLVQAEVFLQLLMSRSDIHVSRRMNCNNCNELKAPTFHLAQSSGQKGSLNLCISITRRKLLCNKHFKMWCKHLQPEIN